MKTTSTLDLFLLALMEQGLAAPYDFKARAGVSVGASAPALRRLEKQGMVSKGAAQAPRERREYTLTAKGRRALERGWRPALNGKIPNDLEAILRLAALALAQSRKPRIAADYLRRAARAQDDLADELDSGSQQVRPRLSDPGSTLLMMKGLSDAERYRSQARTLRRLVRQICRLSV
jgi:DNA-binding PadR family transcriptional regulator